MSKTVSVAQRKPVDRGAEQRRLRQVERRTRSRSTTEPFPRHRMWRLRRTWTPTGWSSQQARWARRTSCARGGRNNAPRPSRPSAHAEPCERRSRPGAWWPTPQAAGLGRRWQSARAPAASWPRSSWIRRSSASRSAAGFEVWWVRRTLPASSAEPTRRCSSWCQKAELRTARPLLFTATHIAIWSTILHQWYVQYRARASNVAVCLSVTYSRQQIASAAAAATTSTEFAEIFAITCQTSAAKRSQMTVQTVTYAMSWVSTVSSIKNGIDDAPVHYIRQYILDRRALRSHRNKSNWVALPSRCFWLPWNSWRNHLCRVFYTTTGKWYKRTHTHTWSFCDAEQCVSDVPSVNCGVRFCHLQSTHSLITSSMWCAILDLVFALVYVL